MITRVCYWCKGTGIERKLPRDNMWNLVTYHVCGGEGVVEAEPESGYIYRWWL